MRLHTLSPPSPSRLSRWRRGHSAAAVFAARSRQSLCWRWARPLTRCVAPLAGRSALAPPRGTRTGAPASRRALCRTRRAAPAWKHRSPKNAGCLLCLAAGHRAVRGRRPGPLPAQHWRRSGARPPFCALPGPPPAAQPPNARRALQSLSAAANVAATAALLRLKAPQAVDAEVAAQVRSRGPPPRLLRWLRCCVRR